MKRLLWYLNQITDNETTTFRYTTMVDGKPAQKEIYDGECLITYLKPGGEADGDRQDVIRREPTYWQGGISYTFERTNRMALDRPTVTIAIPVEMLGIADFTPAAADYCLRKIAPYFVEVNDTYANKSRPDSDNGKFYVYKPGGKVLIRNASYFAMRPAKDYTNGKGAGIYMTRYIDPPPDRMCLCLRIEIQLPHGKLKRMKKILIGHLPNETERFVREFDKEGLKTALSLENKQNAIRRYLRENGYSAFIANGSVLAREKGTDLPMAEAQPFNAASESEIEIGGVRGMGIKNGVTVITGGGYSGKSTVLNAISAGIYNHVAGDGRELCITNESAVTITAEDGRAVSCLNISPFVKWIPGGDAYSFSTTHASGSTSQAANIMEAVESGSTLLLIDEDRSATNFMIRDALMKELVKKEPITPFTDRVRELSDMGISTILVIGGSGEYLSVADKVYMMDEFLINDATDKAKSLMNKRDCAPFKLQLSSCGACTTGMMVENTVSKTQSFPISPTGGANWETNRVLSGGSFSPYPAGSGSERLEVSETGFIIVGDEKIDVRALHNIATKAQVDALAFMLRHIMGQNISDGAGELEAMALAMRGIERKKTMKKIDITTNIHELYGKLMEHGLNYIDTGLFTAMNRFMDLPRAYELRAAINRMRHTAWTKW